MLTRQSSSEISVAKHHHLIMDADSKKHSSIAHLSFAEKKAMLEKALQDEKDGKKLKRTSRRLPQKQQAQKPVSPAIQKTKVEKRKQLSRLYRQNGLNREGYPTKRSEFILYRKPEDDNMSLHRSIWFNIVPYCCVRSVDEKLLQRLEVIQNCFLDKHHNKKNLTGHKYGANKGYNLGLSIVTGGGYAGGGEGIGSIHWTPSVKRDPKLRSDLVEVLSEILEKAFGALSWYKRLKLICDKIRSTRTPNKDCPRVIPNIPVTGLWFSMCPNGENAHCDDNTVGATFLITTSVTKGADLQMLPEAGTLMDQKVSRGTIMAGKWSQFPHTNKAVKKPISLGERNVWTLYLDYRVFYYGYQVVQPKGFR